VFTIVQIKLKKMAADPAAASMLANQNNVPLPGAYNNNGDYMVSSNGMDQQQQYNNNKNFQTGVQPQMPPYNQLQPGINGSTVNGNMPFNRSSGYYGYAPAAPMQAPQQQQQQQQQQPHTAQFQPSPSNHTSYSAHNGLPYTASYPAPPQFSTGNSISAQQQQYRSVQGYQPPGGANQSQSQQPQYQQQQQQQFQQSQLPQQPGAYYASSAPIGVSDRPAGGGMSQGQGNNVPQQQQPMYYSATSGGPNNSFSSTNIPPLGPNGGGTNSGYGYVPYNSTNNNNNNNNNNNYTNSGTQQQQNAYAPYQPQQQ
jgi:hypothetical protein